MSRILTTTALVALLFCSGCSIVSDSMRVSEKNSIWNPVETLAEKKQKSEETAPPETMAAIWNFGVYQKPGSPSVRGLGGRIYFYDANSNAVPAEGELVVYGFDEDSGSATQPDKKFVFRESELQSHFSESALGGSYSVWVPWDKVGGYRKSVTLIPIFKSKDGSILKAGQSINLLAGRIKKQEQLDENEPYRVLGSSSAVVGKPNRSASSGVAQAAFNEQDSENTGGFRQRIRTTAIPLTPNLQRQVELAALVRAGKKIFPVSDSVDGELRAPAAAVANPTQSLPTARTSTASGVFGAPGTLR